MQIELPGREQNPYLDYIKSGIIEKTDQKLEEWFYSLSEMESDGFDVRDEIVLIGQELNKRKVLGPWSILIV